MDNDTATVDEAIEPPGPNPGAPVSAGSKVAGRRHAAEVIRGAQAWVLVVEDLFALEPGRLRLAEPVSSLVNGILRLSWVRQ
jgi:hypothetical protein